MFQLSNKDKKMTTDQQISQLVSQIQMIKEKLSLARNDINNNIRYLEVEFGKFLAEKHNYTHTNKNADQWQEFFPDLVPDAKRLLTIDYAEDQRVVDLLLEESREQFRSKLGISGLNKNVKRALVINALAEGKYWKGKVYNVIKGSLEEEIGGYPFVSQFVVNCPLCLKEDTINYAIPFYKTDVVCPCCKFRYQLYPVSPNTKQSVKDQSKARELKKVVLPTAREWNEAKVKSKSYIDRVVSDAVDSFVNSSEGDTWLSVEAPDSVSIDALDIDKVIPFGMLLHSVSEKEFIDLYRSIFNSISSLVESGDESLLVGSFDDTLINKQEIKDLFCTFYKTEYSGHGDCYHQMVFSKFWLKAIIRNLFIELKIIYQLQVAVNSRSWVEQMDSSEDEWNYIRSFYHSKGFLFDDKFIHYNIFIEHSREWAQHFCIVNADALRKIKFSFDEKNLVARFKSEVLGLRNVGKLTQKRLNDLI